MTRIITEGFEQADMSGLASDTLWNYTVPSSELPYVRWGPYLVSGMDYPLAPRTGRVPPTPTGSPYGPLI